MPRQRIAGSEQRIMSTGQKDGQVGGCRLGPGGGEDGPRGDEG